MELVLLVAIAWALIDVATVGAMALLSSGTRPRRVARPARLRARLHVGETSARVAER